MTTDITPQYVLAALSRGRDAATPICDVCGLRHITVKRPDGLGFVHGYREVDEHYHESYEELLVCSGNYTPGQYIRAARNAERRTGTRGKHPRQDRGNKPTALGITRG